MFLCITIQKPVLFFPKIAFEKTLRKYFVKKNYTDHLNLQGLCFKKQKHMIYMSADFARPDCMLYGPPVHSLRNGTQHSNIVSSFTQDPDQCPILTPTVRYP